MARRNNHIYSAIGVLIIAALLGAIVMGGNVSLNADNIVTVTASDAAGVAVSISTWRAQGVDLDITPTAAVAALTITFDEKYKNLIASANALEIDLRGIQPVVGSNATDARLILTDGTNTVEIGLIPADGRDTIMLDANKLDILNDFATVQLQIKFYDSNGNLANHIAGNAESTISLAFKIMIDTSSIGAFVASTAMAVMAAVRRFALGVAGVASSAAAAVVTNSAIVTIAAGMLVLFAALYVAKPKVKRYF